MLAKILKYGLLEATMQNQQGALQEEQQIVGNLKLTLLDEAVLRIEPIAAKSYHALILSAAIHGNETAPIEWLDGFVSRILAGDLDLQHPLLVLLGNPPAMREQRRERVHNLNRLFSGHVANYSQCYETERAVRLERYVDQFFSDHQQLAPMHLDLHTAIRASQHEKFAVSPYVEDQPRSKKALALMQACGVDCILFSNKPASTFSAYSAQKFGALAFTVELGKVRPFGENDLSKLEQLSQAMTALLSEPKLPAFALDLSRALWFDVSDEVIKTAEDLRFHFADDQANFSEYPNGHLLVEQGGEQLHINDGPKAIVFPNTKVALGQRAVLLVKKLSRDQMDMLEAQGQLV